MEKYKHQHNEKRKNEVQKMMEFTEQQKTWEQRRGRSASSMSGKEVQQKYDEALSSLSQEIRKRLASG